MDNNLEISEIKLRKEQTKAARKLVEQVTQAQAVLRGYLTGLVLESGRTEGSWDFTPDLSAIRSTTQVCGESGNNAR